MDMRGIIHSVEKPEMLEIPETLLGVITKNSKPHLISGENGMEKS